MIARLAHPAHLIGLAAALAGLGVGDTDLLLLGCVLVFVQFHLDRTT